MKHIFSTISLLALMTITSPAQETSQKTVATSEGYSIIITTEEDGQSSVASLVKEENGKQVTLGVSEDLYSLILEHSPSNVASSLADILTATDIKEGGGKEKMQTYFNALAEKYGKEFFNYLPPVAKEAYARNGVTIP